MILLKRREYIGFNIVFVDKCDLKKVVVGGLLRIRDGGAKGKVAVKIANTMQFFCVDFTKSSKANIK